MSHKSVGIELLNIYGLSGYLEQKDLAIERGQDPEKVVHDFWINRRAVNPLYEDVISMAVNAAKPLFDTIDPNSIGLLVVGTESSVDNGKPISTNIHSMLGLPTTVRNFETKHACYSGNAGLQVASDWIASGSHRGRKALIISTDFSRTHFNSIQEFVLGGVASAVIVSDNPKIVEFETDKRGVWTKDVYDTFRPTSRHEIGNNEVSLFSYIDALQGSFEAYQSEASGANYPDFFKYNIFHTPFPGMAFQAHRSLYNMVESHPKKEVMADFNARVLPTLKCAMEVGSCYGASNMVNLAGLFLSIPDIAEHSRIGMFSYGSGAIGEFYSSTTLAGAANIIQSMNIENQLNSRYKLSVSEYEETERKRTENIDQSDIAIAIDHNSAWWKHCYEGKHKCVLSDIKNFERSYSWS